MTALQASKSPIGTLCRACQATHAGKHNPDQLPCCTCFAMQCQHTVCAQVRVCFWRAAFHHGSLVPRVVPFQISLQEALNAFEAWQQSHWLAPSKLLRKGLGSMHAALLPFWIFEATVHVEYAGMRMFLKGPVLYLCSPGAFPVYLWVDMTVSHSCNIRETP